MTNANNYCRISHVFMQIEFPLLHVQFFQTVHASYSYELNFLASKYIQNNVRETLTEWVNSFDCRDNTNISFGFISDNIVNIHFNIVTDDNMNAHMKTQSFVENLVNKKIKELTCDGSLGYKVRKQRINTET